MMRLLTTDAGPAVRLADDDRGRVPFALVGVLLLVGSVTWVVALDAGGRERVQRDAGAALDRGEGIVRTELRQAVTRAGAATAREPVVAPADTEFGRVLDEDQPYRDAFKVRIYRQAADAFEGVDAAVGDVRVEASLPPVTNAPTLRTALDRVTISEAGDGSVQVRVEGIELTARSNGRVIERSERAVTVTVATPALTLHERAETFDRQLDRNWAAGPGFERRLGARLYPLTWARGYAQYGGAPIQNVLANRHVELMTNSALLQTQRSAIGATDPDGRKAMRRATARVGATDLLDGAGGDGQKWVETVLGDHPAPVDDGGPVARAIGDADSTPAPEPGATTTVGVNRSADKATYLLSEGVAGPSLADIVDGMYETRVRRTVETEQIEAEPPGNARHPGNNWTLIRSRTELAQTQVNDSDGATPTSRAGWDKYAAHAREVERTFRNETRWRHVNGTARTTTARWTDRHRVGILVAGAPAASDHAPDKRVRMLYEPGGPVDGHNLADVPETAVTRLLARWGGPDSVAEGAINDDVGDETATIESDVPRDLEGWVYRDVASLRELTRNLSVSARTARLATTANPSEDLAERVESRRDDERASRHGYRSVADKARVAARIAYLDRLAMVLTIQSARVEDTQDGLEETLESADAATGDRLESLLSLRGTASPSDPRPTEAAPPSGDLRLSVDGSPAYLTAASIDRSNAPSLAENQTFHPFAARTTSVFSVPYDSDPGGVIDRVFGDPGQVGLREAARALRAADEVHVLAARRDDVSVDDALTSERAKLRWEVTIATGRLQRFAADRVSEQTPLDDGESQAVARRAFGRWDDTDDRAMAAINGSAARTVAELAAERDETSSTEQFQDELRVELAVELESEARDEKVRLPQETIGTALAAVRAQAKQMTEDAVAAEQERLHREAVQRAGTVPAGLPVTPMPGHWYATLNVWEVDVAGEYASFRIDARHGTPASRGAVDGTTSYVRDGSAVAVNVTGDGTPERLGTASRISFRAEMSVVVVVPPGKDGVGDVDGERTEVSEGWPEPGPSDNP
jgi:hypothetical protein